MSCHVLMFLIWKSKSRATLRQYLHGVDRPHKTGGRVCAYTLQSYDKNELLSDIYLTSPTLASINFG